MPGTLYRALHTAFQSLSLARLLYPCAHHRTLSTLSARCMLAAGTLMPSDAQACAEPARPRWARSVLAAQDALMGLHAAGVSLAPQQVALSSGEHINVLLADEHPESGGADAAGDRGRPTLVLVHGWGAGLGFYSKAVPGMVRGGLRVVMIDLLGCGASARPKYPRKGDVERCTGFFVESLREVLETMETQGTLEKGNWHLAGHSLGGYLSAEFCLRYPGRVRSLVLISPAGLQGRPAEGMTEFERGLTPMRRLLFRSFLKMWEANLTPQAVMRGLGRPLASRLCHGYIRRRLGERLSEEERRVYGDYLVAITLAPGSGEYSMATLLEPGAWARRPVGPRLASLDVATTFIYGDEDWMDWRGAAAAQKKMLNAPSRLVQVENAGHFVFIDNPDGFTHEILTACHQAEAACAASA